MLSRAEIKQLFIRQTVRLGLYVYTILLLTVFLSQNVARAQITENGDTIRVDAGLVDLNVSVFSSGSKQSPKELQKNDFAIFENGKPEDIAFFAAADAPFDLVLLLDMSLSTEKKLKLIIKSSKKFIEAARPIDRIAIYTFTSELKTLAPFTFDRQLLYKNLDRIEKPKGGTNFWDALHYTLGNVFENGNAPRRKAVVVMTDGVDNALPGVRGDGSKTHFGQLIEIVKRSDAIVIPVYLDTEKELMEKTPYLATPEAYQLARAQLSQIAIESGSFFYRANKAEDLDEIYKQVIRDLGTVYKIGYQPANSVRDGAWRAVTVKLINKPDLIVRTKRGYYAN